MEDTLTELANSDNEVDGADEDEDEEDTELGKLSEVDEPGWVMGKISKTVQHRMESFQQKLMKHDERTQLRSGDTADYFLDRDIMYWITELKVLAVVKPHTDTTAATPSPTTSGELMRALHIVPAESQIPQVNSQPGSIQMKQSSEKPQADNHMVYLMPNTVPDSSKLVIVKQVHSISFYHSIYCPLLIAIYNSE